MHDNKLFSILTCIWYFQDQHLFATIHPPTVQFNGVTYSSVWELWHPLYLAYFVYVGLFVRHKLTNK